MMSCFLLLRSIVDRGMLSEPETVEVLNNVIVSRSED